jgi:hypothetical protein
VVSPPLVLPPLRSPGISNKPPPLFPGLERFSELRRAMLIDVRVTRPWQSMPLLPVSLQALTLSVSCRGNLYAPAWLRVAHLTRLCKLTLDGHASYLPLCAGWDAEETGLSLPASLAVLCLRSQCPIELSELVAGAGVKLTETDSKPVISARSTLSAVAWSACPEGTVATLMLGLQGR